MKLTCVTATFNCIKAGNRERLIRCVESVAKLKTEHEHLIYDGASTDGTVELLRELEARTPGLKVVSEPDTGLYYALNKGMRDAKGEWLHVLGADDYICEPAVLDDILSKASNDDEAIVTTVRKQTATSEELWFVDISELGNIFHGPCVCHQGELIRTDIVRRLGGFDTRYRIAADSDLFFKAHLGGVKFRYVFRVFAYFAYGGCATQNLDVAMREHRQSVANVLGLDTKLRKSFVEKGDLLPLWEVLRLLRHPDICIRLSAAKVVRAHIKRWVRFLLYPIVWATRPIRYRDYKVAVRG